MIVKISESNRIHILKKYSLTYCGFCLRGEEMSVSEEDLKGKDVCKTCKRAYDAENTLIAQIGRTSEHE